MAYLTNPILSICIPTYNRSKHLRQALDAIVSQSVFTENDEVEIVISDNCSSDDSLKIVQPYLEKYGDKIIYNRNDKNITDRNFNKVLSLGRGQFLKLLNDTIIMKNGSLNEILSLIKKNLDKKPILFFANGSAKLKKTVESFFSFESFFKCASFQVTWIGAFGIWKEDYERFADFDRAASLRLIQTDVLFRNFEWKKNSIIDNNCYFISNEPEKKGGYDLIDVFATNYFQLLQIPIIRGDLSVNNFKKEKKKILIDFLYPWIDKVNNNPDKFYFDISDWQERLKKHYTGNIIIYANSVYYLKTRWINLKKRCKNFSTFRKYQLK